MWKQIEPEEMQGNVFSMIDREWMLVGAEKEGKINAMTASWGGLGILWGKRVAFVFIRPQRYTKEFVDASQTFSLSFFPEGHRKMLQYMGMVSGRDEDKIAACGLHTELVEKAPVFQEGRLTLICRKLYAQPMTKESFLDQRTDEQNYPQQDYHTMYVAEIEKVLVQD